MCVLRWYFLRKDLSQTGHLNGFSPVCILMCCSRWEANLVDCPQMCQCNSFRGEDGFTARWRPLCKSAISAALNPESSTAAVLIVLFLKPNIVESEITRNLYLLLHHYSKFENWTSFSTFSTFVTKHSLHQKQDWPLCYLIMIITKHGSPILHRP